MTTSRQTKRAALAAIAAALAFAAPATAADGEYVPFVTDFPKPAVPVQVPAAPGGPTQVAADESGFQWGSAAAGAGAGLGAAVLIGLGLALRTRRTAVA
jgi:hypothetical protein